MKNATDAMKESHVQDFLLAVCAEPLHSISFYITLTLQLASTPIKNLYF